MVVGVLVAVVEIRTGHGIESDAKTKNPAYAVGAPMYSSLISHSPSSFWTMYSP